jgi:hypothetical protein
MRNRLLKCNLRKFSLQQNKTHERANPFTETKFMSTVLNFFPPSRNLMLVYFHGNLGFLSLTHYGSFPLTGMAGRLSFTDLSYQVRFSTEEACLKIAWLSK